MISGSNQKSNRSPKMDLDDEDALLALDELRDVGAASEVQGSGRVDEVSARGLRMAGRRQSGSGGDDRVAAARSTNGGRDPHARLADARLRDLKRPSGDRRTDRERTRRSNHSARPRTDVRSHALPARRNANTWKQDREAGRPRARPTPAEAKIVVDQLLARLDAVNERIESLEKRIAELES